MCRFLIDACVCAWLQTMAIRTNKVARIDGISVRRRRRRWVFVDRPSYIKCARHFCVCFDIFTHLIVGGYELRSNDCVLLVRYCSALLLLVVVATGHCFIHVHIPHACMHPGSIVKCIHGWKKLWNRECVGVRMWSYECTYVCMRSRCCCLLPNTFNINFYINRMHIFRARGCSS